MTQIFNKEPFLKLRKKLRNRPTQAENKLWYFLKKNFLGVKFRRQYGIGRYVVDFYSPALHLVIEVDGDSHAPLEARENDLVRQREIESLGLWFVRFTNEDVLCNMEGVLDELRKAIGQRRPPLTPPS